MTRVVNNTLYHFVGSNLGAEIFLKKREHQKIFTLKQRIEYVLYWGFKKMKCKACLLLYCFSVIKIILKALFSCIPWLLNFSDLPSHGLNSGKRYTLTLLSMCLERSTPHPPILGIKPIIDSLFNSLRWDPFSLPLRLYFS